MPVLPYLLAVAVFAQGTSEFVLAGLLPGISDDLDVSLAHAGLLTSAFAVGMAVGAPAMAALGRGFPPRASLSAFLAVFIAAHLVGAMTGSFGALLVTRVVAALANAGFLAVALATVADAVAPARRARALAVILGGTTLALVAGVPGGALIGSWLGWRAALLAIAAVSVPALVAVLVALPARHGGAGRDGRPVRLGAELAVLRRAPLRLNLLLAVLVNAATFCTFTYLAAIGDDAGLGDVEVPLLLGVFGFGAFLGVSAAGRLADRHGRRLLTAGGPLLLAGWLTFGAASSSAYALWPLALTQGALSFALGGTLIARVMASADGAPTMGGSFATAALNVGAVVGPVTGGIAIDVSGTEGPLMASAVLVLLACAVWLPWWARTRGVRDGTVHARR